MTYTRNILVVRLSALGDILISVPLVKAYAKANPKTLFTVLSAPMTQEFFKGVENIRFIADPLKKKKAGFFGIVKYARELVSSSKRSGEPITAVADIHDVLRTKVLRTALAVSGMKVASINKERAARNALTREKNKVLAPIKSSMRKYEEVFVRLGLKDLNFSTAPYPMNSLEGRTYVAIGIAPFAAQEGKVWPFEYVEECVRILSGDPNNRIHLFGGGKKEKEALEMLESNYPNTVSEAGKHTLFEEGEIISKLDVMVTMDSANMHLASLVGTPVISIWGATHPFAGFYGHGQNPEWAMGLALPCRPCSVYGKKPCTKGNYPCMRGIKPEALVEKIHQVISQRASQELNS